MSTGPYIPVRESINKTSAVLDDKQLNRLKAAYCKVALETDSSELLEQERVFKIALKENTKTAYPINNDSWAALYDQIDQHFRELFSDYTAKAYAH